jgi:hypothetical protein
VGARMKFYNIEDIKDDYRRGNGHFFDKDAMRFFKSRLCWQVYQGKKSVYFVTSERYESRWSNDSKPRKYTVRQYNPADKSIETIGEFNVLSKYMAHKIAKEMAVNE